MNETKKELVEFVKLAQELREKDRDVFLEIKGYLRGLVHKEQLVAKKNCKMRN